MAPVLRTRKAAATSEKAAEKPAPATQKKAAPPKRKAAEESSPVSLKKQKPTKPSPSTKPAGKKNKETKAAKKPEEVEPPSEETRIDVPQSGSDSESDGEEEEGVKALAAQIDPEDDDGVKGKSLFKPGQDVGKAPKITKKGGKDAAAADEGPGVIYVGRIPHGFYEHEMKQYFSQFGPISKLRLSRNKKTGASKHFAFVEFAEASTAEIVAKTMDNYLLFGHILKCKILPKEQVHEDLFKGANKRFKKVPWNKMAGKQLEKPLSETEWKGKISREKNKRAQQAEKLKALGYDFEPPTLKDAPPPAALENGEEAKAIEAPTTQETEEEKPAEQDKATDVADEPATEEVKSAPKAKATKSKTAKATKGRKAKAKA
ncbi:RNA-binding protein [Paramyrothecium foliicola]|nr:RNA-binding protein [Paramyrothecium foliicola]